MIWLRGSATAVGGAVLAAAVAVLTPVTGTAPPTDTPATGVSYVAPLPRPLDVLRPFDAPPEKYGPGHLGVDLRAHQGQPVEAAAAGTVQFAGPVAGRGVVVLLHPDGIRTEYEPVRATVSTGDHVAAAAVIGSVHGQHGDGAISCLHWGARRGETYLDPLALLRPLGPVVLLPDRGAR